MNDLSNVPYAEFVAALAKPGAAIVASMTAEKAHMLHMAIGIAGEAGELLSAIAAHAHLKAPLDRVNVIEELGDVEFYAEGLRQGAELNIPVVKTPVRALGMEVHAALLSVAAADVLDQVKKHVIYNKAVLRSAIEAQMAALTYQMACLRHILGVSQEEVILANKQKLGARYSSGSYSDQQAQARADKAAGE